MKISVNINQIKTARIYGEFIQMTKRLSILWHTSLRVNLIYLQCLWTDNKLLFRHHYVFSQQKQGHVDYMREPHWLCLLYCHWWRMLSSKVKQPVDVPLFSVVMVFKCYYCDTDASCVIHLCVCWFCQKASSPENKLISNLVQILMGCVKWSFVVDHRSIYKPKLILNPWLASGATLGRYSSWTHSWWCFSPMEKIK